jgi:hypothetical protein
MRVFISSVFAEPGYNPETWEFSLRKSLAEALSSRGWESWRYETEALNHGATDRAPIKSILYGLGVSDVVVVLYRKRHGSKLLEEPFLAVPFEIRNAIHLSKPIHLYVLGDRLGNILRSTLEVFSELLLVGLADKVFYLDEWDSSRHESDILRKILENLGRFSGATSSLSSSLEPDSALDFADLERKLSVLGSEEQFGRALDLALPVNPLRGRGIGPRKGEAYAHLLGTMANLFANSAHYDDAIRYSVNCVRAFMESGLDHQAFAQIQCTSGILNMAGYSDLALNWNNYGLSGGYRDLVQPFLDSRGSIAWSLAARKGTLVEQARRILEKSHLKSKGGAYELSKYLVLLPDLETAHRRIAEEALTQALQLGRSVGYVLQHAARVALRAGEHALADEYIAQGTRYCEARGLNHTLRKFQWLTALSKFVRGRVPVSWLFADPTHNILDVRAILRHDN